MTTPAEIFRAPRRHQGSITHGRADKSYRAFELLYGSFILLPLIAGSGKLMNLFANWETHLAPIFGTSATAPALIDGLGIFEIVLGVLVAAAPRLGGRVAAAWLCLGAINLLLIPGHYGVVLCLLTLAVAALALSLLAGEFVEGPAEAETPGGVL